MESKWTLETLFIILLAEFSLVKTVKSVTVMVVVIAAISMKDITCLETPASAHAEMSHLTCRMQTTQQEHAQPALTIVPLAILQHFARHAHLIIFYTPMQLANFLASPVRGTLIAPKVL